VAQRNELALLQSHERKQRAETFGEERRFPRPRRLLLRRLLETDDAAVTSRSDLATYRVDRDSGDPTTKSRRVTHAPNGRKLGTTPLVEVPMLAGHHKLRAVNTAAKIDREIEVSVQAHQVVELPRVRF
jgi:hypothetical protein